VRMNTGAGSCRDLARMIVAIIDGARAVRPWAIVQAIQRQQQPRRAGRELRPASERFR